MHHDVQLLEYLGGFIFGTIGLGVLFVIYLINAFAWFNLGKKANLSYSILAFVPILQFLVFFGIIRKSFLWGLLYLIPGINLLAYLYFNYLFYKNFNTSDIIIILCLVFPPLGQLYMLYMAFSYDVRYVPYYNNF